MDNITVMHYINRQRGARSSPLCARKLYISGIDSSIILLLHQLYTTVVGHLNRDLSKNHKDSLKTLVFLNICYRLGFLQADNCPRFCSKWGIRRGSLSDTFLILWAPDLMYTFPSIPMVMRKLRQAAGHIIMIVTAWARQFWYLDLMNLSVWWSIIFITLS